MVPHGAPSFEMGGGLPSRSGENMVSPEQTSGRAAAFVSRTARALAELARSTLRDP
jgi:hypothetical protein